MTGFLVLPRPCLYCKREIAHPDSRHPWKSCPDRGWLQRQISLLTGDIDKECSFGPNEGADIPLCQACANGLFTALDPDTILDYRDGGSTPKIIDAKKRG